MSCRGIESLISRHVDGLLSPRQEAQLLEHLGQCHGCASRLARYRQMDLLLRRLPRKEPPAELRQAVLAGVEKRRPFRAGFSWGTVAAAAGIFIIAGAISAAGVRWPFPLFDGASLPPAAPQAVADFPSATEAGNVAEVASAAAVDDAAVLVQVRRTIWRPGFRPLLPGYLPRGAKLSAVNFGRGHPGGPIDRLEVAFAAGRDQLSLRQTASTTGAAEQQQLSQAAAMKKVTLGDREWLVVRHGDGGSGNLYLLVGEREGITIWLESSIPVDELERVAASLRD